MIYSSRQTLNLDLIRQFYIKIQIMRLRNLIKIFIFCIYGMGYSQDPYVDPHIITSLKSAPTADILCILHSTHKDLKRYTDRLNSKNEKGVYVFTTLKVESENTQQEIKKYLSKNGYEYKAFYIVNAIHVPRADRALVEHLGRKKEVSVIIYNDSYFLDNIKTESPSESKASLESREPTKIPSWGIVRIKADSLRALGFKGKGIVICTNDTGVDLIPPLKTNYRGYRSNGSFIHDYNWHDAIVPSPFYNGGSICGINTLSPCDDEGHGTRVTSVFASNDPDISVSPESTWIATRALLGGFSNVATLLECLEWNLAPTDSHNKRPDPSKAPDIINNSWGCGGHPNCSRASYPVFDIAINNLVAAGIFVVNSAGNDGSFRCSSLFNPPSILENAFTVGAMDENDSISIFSSIGPVTLDGSNRLKPNVVAPGRQIPSYNKSGAIENSLGTSISAPYVAASVALLISALPALSGRVDLIRHILQTTASPNVIPRLLCGNDRPLSFPNSNAGYGLVDVYAAYKYAKKFLNDERRSELKAHLLVYPNPAITEVNVSTQFKKINAIRLHDSSGRQLQNWQSLDTESFKINFEYPSGIYFLTIIVENRVITKKILHGRN